MDEHMVDAQSDFSRNDFVIKVVMHSYFNGTTKNRLVFLRNPLPLQIWLIIVIIHALKNFAGSFFLNCFKQKLNDIKT